MSYLDLLKTDVSRRHFLTFGKNALGTAAVASLMGRAAGAGETSIGLPKPHFPPKAKNVIYLHMVGGPSQIDLFDYKPMMREMYDKDLPDSIRQGQCLTTMTSKAPRLPS